MDVSYTVLNDDESRYPVLCGQWDQGHDEIKISVINDIKPAPTIVREQFCAALSLGSHFQ